MSYVHRTARFAIAKDLCLVSSELQVWGNHHQTTYDFLPRDRRNNTNIYTKVQKTLSFSNNPTLKKGRGRVWQRLKYHKTQLQIIL